MSPHHGLHGTNVIYVPMREQDETQHAVFTHCLLQASEEGLFILLPRSSNVYKEVVVVEIHQEYRYVYLQGAQGVEC